ncbi:NADP-dependent oxidoreductase [Dysgonomonas sp. ZJ279]|uniref:NADP-dependent oxidoreductase n=1 Tax=Dysgonomonas sp. ZJ279 TaxID=2709796 RepID=UPI0013ED5D03|nr:NADP-dependent oxidoreductase [Dysgonomonas sp. ZJ279]
MKVKQIELASRPQGLPTNENFRFREIELPAIQAEEVLLKPLYISVDPYMRGRMSDAKSYAPPFEINQPIAGGVVAVVEESKSSKFKKGDKVLGMLPWATYSIQKTDGLQKIDDSIPESYYLGIVGMPGLTAYFGLTDICNPQQGETVVVSGAAGAVGTIVGQIAKIKGCRVIGIAGSDDKAKLLKEKFGYDEVINYKTSDIFSVIEKACPSGVDCYYDNVGGDITDAVIAHFNKYARMALCGQISLYNETSIPMGPRILTSILKTSALIKGFIVSDYQTRFPEGIAQLVQWVKEGKLKYTETTIEGFDQLPKAFLGLFDGSNTGKMIVKI